MPASRKRRTADGRLASPPLAPSPLAQRNLQLLPVSLTQLPNDVEFVHQCRQNVGHLLTAFARSCVSSLTNTSKQTTIFSPFAEFGTLYLNHGWHLAQFNFGDHTDSKRHFGNSICRILLERLDCTKKAHFSSLEDLFTTVAVPFALYTLWDSQLCAESGIGVKPNRKDMPTIPIEQDVYDWLLHLPQAVLTYLKSEAVTLKQVNLVVSEVSDIVLRLAGHTISPVTKGKQKSSTALSKPVAVFDIIPAREHGTRRPRIWPSVRVMSTQEADKQYHRIGRVIRVQDGEVPQRESAVGLSRGDLIRIRARQRLDWKLADLPEVQPPDTLTSDVLTRDANGSSSVSQQNSGKSTRFELEVSPWAAKAKNTAKLNAWLDATSQPLEQALDQLTQSRDKYERAKFEVMSTLNERTEESTAAESSDFSSSLLGDFVALVNGATSDQDALTSLAGLSSEASQTMQQELYRTAAQQTRQAIMAMTDQINARLDNL